MPRYDFRCEACGHEFVMRRGVDANKYAPCPKCDEDAARRYSSAPHVAPLTGIPNRIEDEWLDKKRKRMQTREREIREIKAAEHAASRER